MSAPGATQVGFQRPATGKRKDGDSMELVCAGLGDRDGLPAAERHELGLGGHGELLRGVLLRGVPAAPLLKNHENQIFSSKNSEFPSKIVKNQ